MILYGYLCGCGREFEGFAPSAAYNEPKKCECGLMAPRAVSAPMVIGDGINPTWGADGKLHDSRTSLEFSYTPEGNKKGLRYHRLGDKEAAPRQKEHKPDKEAIAQTVKKTLAQAVSGNLPPVGAKA